MDASNASLAELRHQAGLSQEEMAHRLGISRSYYNALECGRREPGRWLLKTLQVLKDELMRTKSTNEDKVHNTDGVKHATGEEDIINYLKPWFEHIGRDPDVAPFMLAQLRKHLPYDDLNLFRS